jgi:hypothetical protein
VAGTKDYFFGDRAMDLTTFKNFATELALLSSTPRVDVAMRSQHEKMVVA